MTLQRQLDAKLAEVRTKMPVQAGQLITAGMAELAGMGLGLDLPDLGSPAPDFSLPNQIGDQIRQADLLANGPLVIAFYRGSWCPFCNLTLRAYQSVIDEIEGLGASLVAVSPERADRSRDMVAENRFRFDVLHDANNAYASKYGIAFRVPEAHDTLMNKFGLSSETINGAPGWALPDTSTFIVDSDGTIAWRFTPNGDYTVRADPHEILEELQQLRDRRHQRTA